MIPDYLSEMHFANNLKICRTLLKDLDTKLEYGNLINTEATALIVATLSTCKEVLES